jgi:hypothetical protein
MKQALFLTLLTVMLAFPAGSSLCQTQDLSGVWVGETVVSGMIDKDLVTLVLKKDAGSYSGTVSDSMEMAKDSPLEEVKFENDTLTAQFMIYNGSEDVRIWMTLKVTGEKLIGNWEDGGGETGPLDLKRKID